MIQEQTPHVVEQPQPIGLSEQEAAARRERGLGNNVRIDTGRTYMDILRQNFFTFINVILFVIGLLMILLGLYGDAFVSVGVVLMNVIVSVVQEFRAKAKLDRIALLTRPKATVIRDGQPRQVDPSELVIGDVIVCQSGDQMVVDGVVVGDGKMEVDESLLTGESDLIVKRAGDEVFSGSFCVTGSAQYEATRVGRESFANKLTASAKQFRITRTPLQQDINLVVRVLVLLAMVVGVFFGAAFIIRSVSTREFVQTAAVIAGLVPAGLILMTTTAYAMGALRMSGRGALIQQSNAVESISNVNVLCLDKTGTLTANRINYHGVYPLMDGLDEKGFKSILGDYARSARAGNRTSEALEICNGRPRQVRAEIPFSSARKWSALSFDDPDRRGVVVLGAPEMLAVYVSPEIPLGQAQMDEWAQQGLRVLLALYHPEPVALYDEQENPLLPHGLIPLGVVSFSDELRPEARETLEGFRRAGIELKIISGDNPQTVAALALQAGFPPDVKLVSGVELAQMSDGQVRQAAVTATIFGRITPEQKEMLVDGLKAEGKYVAMIGDGVNDVLSLKKAHIGIAMQSGSAATRGVADLVLMNDSFAALPAAFIEGQRILNGMDDILKLFITRAFFATLIILGTAVVAEAGLFPFIPKHASLITLITVAAPTLAMAAWARPGVPKHNLARTLMHFVLPAALTMSFTALAVYAYYLNEYWIPVASIAQGFEFKPPSPEEIEAISIARSALTTSLVLMGLILVLFTEPPIPWFTGGDQLSGDWRPTILAGVMFGVYVLIHAYDPLRVFFELERLAFTDYFFITLITVVWAYILRFTWRAQLVERFFGVDSDRLTKPPLKSAPQNAKNEVVVGS